MGAGRPFIGISVAALADTVKHPRVKNPDTFANLGSGADM
jgi:hypothetical protein